MSAPARKSKRRTMPDRARDLPPPGWVETTPGEPPDDCSWCGTQLLYVRGAWICAVCDSMLLWPHERRSA